ncbi:MAG: hypothetical protein V7699_00235 [Porticoccus sp.]
MVDSIGPNKIKSITKSKPVVSGTMEKPKRDCEQSDKDTPDQESKNKKIGVNIDERC